MFVKIIIVHNAYLYVVCTDVCSILARLLLGWLMQSIFALVQCQWHSC